MNSEDLVTWLRGVLDEDERMAQGEINVYEPGPYEWMLADVAAKRAILDRYKNEHYHAPAIPGATSPELQREETGACRTCVTVRLLASAYAERPGYRQEWKP